MKFKLNDSSRFSDIGTVVYYHSRPFYPELTEARVEELLPYGLSENYLFSTPVTSEYTDFAKTGFSFTYNTQDYKRNVIPNLYDYQEITKLSDISDLDSLVSVAFPSVSQGMIGQEKKHFFGRLETPTSTAYLINLPKEVWKVEVYNSRITENYHGDFIDYDILTKLGLTPTESPVLTIYFGPMYDVYIQDITYQELRGGDFKMYLDRYTLSGEVFLEEEEYDSFLGKKIMTRTEYVESYQEEVMSEKMLYIVNSPDGGLETINFYSLAYPNSHNPHPHRSEVILRNDHGDPNLIEEKGKGFLVDSRSGVLLGIKALTKIESPWIHGALRSPQEYSRSGKMNSTQVNGKTWVKVSESDVFGANPELSPWWYCTEEMPESDFKYYYITSLGRGSISPSGLIYLGPGKPLKLGITPERGYMYGGFSNVFDRDVEVIEEDGRKTTVEVTASNYKKGYNFEVIFKEISYLLNLQIDCLRDFPGNGGLKNTYNLYELGNSTGTNYTPLSSTNIKLKYRLGSGEEGEFGSPGDPYNKSNPLKITDTSKLYFKLDTLGTPYELSGELRYGDESPIDKEGEWYVLDVADFPDSTGDYIIPIGELVSKKYTVLIRSTSGIQISTPKKNVMEYHNIDPKLSSPTPRPFITRMILGPSNTIEVWQDGRLMKNGSGVWSLTEGDYGIWTFTVPQIENNYEIIIK